MRLTQDAQTLENIKRITVFSILIFRFILCRRHSFKSHFCKVYINIANVYIKCYQIIVSFQCNAFSYAPILNQITGIWLILLFSCIIYVLRIPITVQMFFFNSFKLAFASLFSTFTFLTNSSAVEKVC